MRLSRKWPSRRGVARFSKSRSREAYARPMRNRPLLIVLLSLLATAIITGCGGMNRAVGVLPNTADDLAKRTEPFRVDGRAES